MATSLEKLDFIDFETANRLCTFLSRSYAEEVLTLLINYRDLSASELASRLRLHIRTMQEFLEGLVELGIITKEEVYEKKRPYFRYRLAVETIEININLTALKRLESENEKELRIRESASSGAKFTIARSDNYISNVVVWLGEGRNREERKINLTMPQGRFLYHLPFPNAPFKGVSEIFSDTGLNDDVLPEINDLVELLTSMNVLETEKF